MKGLGTSWITSWILYTSVWKTPIGNYCNKVYYDHYYHNLFREKLVFPLKNLQEIMRVIKWARVKKKIALQLTVLDFWMEYYSYQLIQTSIPGTCLLNCLISTGYLHGTVVDWWYVVPTVNKSINCKIRKSWKNRKKKNIWTVTQRIRRIRRSAECGIANAMTAITIW